MLTITNENFESEVLKSDVPVLVDFWAPWCGPCKMIGPIIEELDAELAGTVKVAKLNVDDVQDVAIQYQVMSIPTIIVFKDGEVYKKSIGFKDKASLLDLVK